MKDKKSKTKLCALLVALTMGATMLAGCGSGQEAKSSGATEAAEAVTEAAESADTAETTEAADDTAETTEAADAAEGTTAESADTTAAETVEAAGTTTVVLDTVDPESLNRTGYDVIFVVDHSRSVWKQQEQINQALKTITNLAVGSDIRIGVVYFAGSVCDGSTLGLTSVETKADAKKVLNALNYTKQDESNIDTNIGKALAEAVDLFDAQDSSRQRIVVLFSDGMNENAAQDASYKEKADAKTEKEAKILQEMGIPIYCVYLQKDRNDTSYLKQIVNYFGDEDNSDRFKSVKAANIDKLSDTFTDVFYSIQGNMKYRTVKFDAGGTQSFYIPSLGITKLSIYLNNADGGDINYPEAAADCDHESWTDDSATFVQYTDPTPGSWSLTVKNPSSAKGIIAYYADLKAGAEVTRQADGTCILTADFSDESGNDVAIDNAAKVTASAVYAEGDKAGETAAELTMTITEDGTAVSEPFNLTDYGAYDFTMELTYEDFVDLNYCLSSYTVGKTAPVTTDMTGAIFDGEKTEDGRYEFVLEEKNLFTDPEGETVNVTGVTQISTGNEVQFVNQENGCIYLTSTSADAVSFKLNLVDSSDMTAEVSVQGTVNDAAAQRAKERMIRTILTVIALVAAFFAIRIFLHSMERKRLKEQIDNNGRRLKTQMKGDE